MTVVLEWLPYYTNLSGPQVNNTTGQRAKGVCGFLYVLLLFKNNAGGWGRLLMLISYLGWLLRNVSPNLIIMIGINKWPWL